ncbi:MAG: hypothetical protein GF417_09505 [Candidatus Latescibacteria bacterium]|nr:hypothetical protein [bacterium]MBD3424660.1 hypothetical protein [Candidatus Latescibacterota bacterium]
MSMRESINKICGVILAAGYGTRMRPLTDTIPKPLVPVMGRVLLEIILSKMARSGAGGIHANIHHLADSFNQTAFEPGVPLKFHFEQEILGTGGGIGNMGPDIGENDLILIHNSDIISNVEFLPAIDFHLQKNALFTMILLADRLGRTGPGAKRLPPPSVHISDSAEVLRIGPDPSRGGNVLGYTGMAVVSAEALSYFPAGRKAGLVDILRRMIRERAGSVAGYDASEHNRDAVWAETGTPEGYLDLHSRILLEGIEFDRELKPPPLPLHVAEGAKIGRDTRWKGFLEVGEGAVVGRNSVLENCVIFPQTVLESGTEAEYSIFFPGGILKAGTV